MAKKSQNVEIHAVHEENIVTLPIKKLVKATWNYKEDDDILLEKLKNNLKRNGQVENIVVRLLDTGFYEVVNGNHRYQAMLDLGYNDIIAYNLGSISDTEAKRIAIELNETRFKTDDKKLGSIFTELKIEYNIEDLINSMPFTPLDIQAYGDIAKDEFNEYASKPETRDKVEKQPDNSVTHKDKYDTGDDDTDFELGVDDEYDEDSGDYPLPSSITERLQEIRELDPTHFSDLQKLTKMSDIQLIECILDMFLSEYSE